MVKPGVYDAIRSFFALYGKEEDIAWHEKRDPETHNYQLDNRKAAYEFFSNHFNIPLIQEDPGIGSEVKSYDELVVGLRPIISRFSDWRGSLRTKLSELRLPPTYRYAKLSAPI